VHDLIAAGYLVGDAELIGHMYWVALHGAIMLHLAHMLPPDYGAEKILAELLERLNRSLMPTPART
jgi:hypothetical protein